MAATNNLDNLSRQDIEEAIGILRNFIAINRAGTMAPQNWLDTADALERVVTVLAEHLIDRND